MTPPDRIPPTLKPQRILTIDPGSEQSAWLVWESAGAAGRLVRFGITANEELLPTLRDGSLIQHVHVVVIEKIESYGMAVGREVFDTVHWSGRFTEAARPAPVVQLPRRDVKLAICGNSRAKDANIRAELINRFGGKAAAVGTRAAPGPLYGVSRDVWSALAIAVTWSDAARSALTPTGDEP